MKKLFVILIASILLAASSSFASAPGSFFTKANVSRDELVSALEGDESLLADGVTTEILRATYVDFYNKHLGKNLTYEEGVRTIVRWLRSAEEITLPANKKLMEARWENNRVKEKEREVVPGEIGLWWPKSGKVIATRRCGNPAFMLLTPDEPVVETPPDVPLLPLPPIAQEPETIYVEKPVPVPTPMPSPPVQAQVPAPQIQVLTWPVVPNYPTYSYPTYPAPYYSAPSYGSCYPGSVSFGIRLGFFGSSNCGYGYSGYSGYNNNCSTPTYYSPPQPSCPTVYRPRTY